LKTLKIDRTFCELINLNDHRRIVTLLNLYALYRKLLCMCMYVLLTHLQVSYLLNTVAASSDKRNVSVWHPSVRLSVYSFFLTLTRHAAHTQTWLTRGQHATRSA